MRTPERNITVGGYIFPCAELLGRAEWAPQWDDAELHDQIGPALITGGAGSIGAALAGRLARAGVPVCITDADERAMDALEREIPPSGSVQYRLCDVSDATQVLNAVNSFAPRTIYHLAAKKHVKYAENAARNAILSNVLGTWNMLEAARGAKHVKNAICASSDKAVAATNLLGETKRAAERITTAFATQERDINIASVRLCNVLGTSGNVLDHYVDEAKRGVTLDVWSRDMTRYFCSLHEAVDLFLHAALRPSAPVITLDPGPATPIADLADRVCALLSAQGLPARYEISERFAPMHARHEELWTDSESITATATPPAPVDIRYTTRPNATLLITNTKDLDNTAMCQWLQQVLSTL